MNNSDMFGELQAFARAGALAAGVDPDDLDGPPRCFSGCGAVVARLAATCSACGERIRAGEHDEAVKRAWGTTPSSLHWVHLWHPQIGTWARDSGALARTRDLAKDLGALRFVTFIGEPGSGKTTLACALLREWVRLGAKVSAPAAARHVARRVRFAAAQDLLQDRSDTRLGEHVVSIDQAASATVLVLDEVGRGKDPHGVIFSLLHERHREQKATLITTPHSDATALAAATGDGGLARRVFDDGQRVDVRKVLS